jgi:hypothetical protein
LRERTHGDAGDGRRLVGSDNNHTSAERRTQRGERDSYMKHTGTMTPTPQRLQALERANEIRLARAELKRRIAEGEVSVADVLLDPPFEAGSWAIGDLLMSQRRWGSSRCRKFLFRHHIMETKPVSALTERQRRLLAGQLEESCETRELELIGA